MNDTERFESLQTTIKLDPKNFQARRELIMLCLDLGFESAALSHIKYLLEIFPDDANLYFNTGICWEKLKNLDNALIAYKKAVELKPEEPDFLYNLALVYEAKGNIDEAMKHFKKVIFYKNEDANAFFSIGVLYSKKNDPQTAIKCFKKAIEYNYSDYFAHFFLAGEYKKIKEIDFALVEYKKVLELSPDYSWAYFNIAQIYWELGRVDDAYTMLEKTLEKNPKDMEANKILAQIMINQTKIDEALEFLTSLAQNHQNGDIYYLMAKIFEINEDPDSQRDCLELALEFQSSLTFNVHAVKRIQRTKQMTNEEIKYFAAFSYFDIRPYFKSKLLEYFEYSAKAAFCADLSDVQKVSEYFETPIPKGYFEKKSKLDPQECYKNAFLDKDVKIITCKDELYPPLLREIPDYPISLYYKGNLEDIDYNFNLAVVGSRQATQEAKIALDSIISGLKNTNITIVSGLAYGIDTQAHKSAINYNLKTIAVVGCGLDIVYPAANRELFNKIKRTHGAIMSEYPLKTRPEARNFPQRNRIVTGMSKGTLVAEAQLKSGAMISANLTLDYNRELMCIPGNIMNPNTQGIYHLIENGAAIIVNTKDLLNQTGWDIILEETKISKNNLSKMELQILDIISKEAKTFDEIALSAKEDVSKIMVSLTELEIKGLIKQANNKYYKTGK